MGFISLKKDGSLLKNDGVHQLKKSVNSNNTQFSVFLNLQINRNKYLSLHQTLK